MPPEGIQCSLLLRIGSGVGIDRVRLCEVREELQLGVSQPRKSTPDEPVFAALYAALRWTWRSRHCSSRRSNLRVSVLVIACIQRFATTVVADHILWS